MILVGLLVAAFISYKVYESGEGHNTAAAIVVGMIALVVLGFLITGDPAGLTSDCWGNGLRESAGC